MMTFDVAPNTTTVLQSATVMQAEKADLDVSSSPAEPISEACSVTAVGPQTDKRSGRRKASKTRHVVYLSNIPENATRANIFGAVRGHIGKFHSLSCSFIGVGVCQLALRRASSQQKLVEGGPFKIFGIDVTPSAEVPDAVTETTDSSGCGYCPVFFRGIPEGTEIKKLLGTVRKIVGPFVAMNKVTVDATGGTKLTFNNVWQREKLLECGLDGELELVECSATPFSGSATTPTVQIPVMRANSTRSLGECSDGRSATEETASSASSGSLHEGEAATSWDQLIASSRSATHSPPKEETAGGWGQLVKEATERSTSNAQLYGGGTPLAATASSTTELLPPQAAQTARYVVMPSAQYGQQAQYYQTVAQPMAMAQPMIVRPQQEQTTATAGSLSPVPFQTEVQHAPGSPGRLVQVGEGCFVPAARMRSREGYVTPQTSQVGEPTTTPCVYTPTATAQGYAASPQHVQMAAAAAGQEPINYYYYIPESVGLLPSEIYRLHHNQQPVQAYYHYPGLGAQAAPMFHPITVPSTQGPQSSLQQNGLHLVGSNPSSP